MFVKFVPVYRKIELKQRKMTVFKGNILSQLIAHSAFVIECDLEFLMK